MKRFIKEYAVELISAGLVLIGVFLVLETPATRAKIIAPFSKVIHAILSALEKILSGASSRAELITPSDILGGLLLLLALGFVIWRIRYRFKTSKRWAIDQCPKCSGPVIRVHRTWWDRILGAAFLPDARRYRCADADCGWGGLMRRNVHRPRRHSKPASGPEKT